MEKQTSIDILYDIALSKLQNQIRRIDGADAKIGIVFGLTNGLAAALGASIVVHPCSIPWYALIFMALSGVCYVITLVFLYFAYRWGSWSFRPEIETLKEICISPKYRDFPQVTKEWIADECILSIEANKPRLSRKVKIANTALKTLSLQGLFLIVYYIMLIIS